MEILDQGMGEMFMDPDPDVSRSFFRNKQRKMTGKVMELKEAVKGFVNDGDYLGIGGFGANRTPIAACHEIVRQGKKKLGFAGHTSTHDMEVLSAGEAYDRLDVAYVVGLEARGLSTCSRRYVESGKVKVTEWTNYALSLRLQAAAMGVPFLPARNMMGTDTFKYSAAKVAKCPFTGKKLVLLPALSPDVAIIHVHEADKFGNSRFKGISVSDEELANASKKVIITTERLIPSEEIKRDPTSTRIPYFLVDAVCEVPYGGYPGTMPYEYFSDEEHLKEWLKVEKDEEEFKAFLDRNIYGCKNHDEYILLNGGYAKMRELRARELLLHKEQ
ncbi:MAG: CoA transferase subunit A [Desulfobacteraceae bacterium]|nr:CoA transferase subunit A [Desulfobacteraceae bacterium]